MMLFLAISMTFGAAALVLFIAFAYGMSDNPEDKPNYGCAWPVAIFAVILWACWYFGWHPSW